MIPLSGAVEVIYLSMGRPDLALRVTLIGAPILIGGMASGIPWGIFGVAVGYALASEVSYWHTPNSYSTVG